MRLTLRPILAGLAPVLLTAFLAGSVTGCSSDDEPNAEGPTVTATGRESTDDATDPTTGTPSDSPSETTTTGATSATPDRQDLIAAACTPYTTMVTAIKDAASTSTDPDATAAQIGPVLKEFAAQVPALEPPPGLPAETWQGVVALAEQITKLPARPTDAEIEAVQDQLSEQEQGAIEDAFSWFQTNCT